MKERAMMEAREMGRLYMKVINNVAGTIADYNLKSMKLSSASALSSFEYVSRLTGSRTALEMIECSGAHYRNQLNVLGGYADDLVDLASKTRKMWQDPSMAS
jgi:hypothetical protein